MNCEKSRELFADYLGEELSSGDGRELQLHLRSCEGCRRELALLGSAKATLKEALPEVAIPQRLAFDLSRPRRQDWLQGFFRSRYTPWAAAAACFVSCAAALALFQAQLRVDSEGLQISFGSQSPAVVQTPPVAQPAAVATLGADDVDRLIEGKLARLEQAQSARFESRLAAAKSEWQAQRRQDWQQMTADLRYLEANQRSMVQDAARNSSYIQTLAHNLYAKDERPATVQ